MFFSGPTFITIAKSADKEWYLIKPAILGVIMEHFTAGRPVMLAESAPAESPAAVVEP